MKTVQITRQTMRQYFQPSRILLASIFDKRKNKENLLPLAFNMYCSYNPLMIAIAIQECNYSYELIHEAEQYVLSVPSEEMAETVLKCGLASGKVVDKIAKYDIEMQTLPNCNTRGVRQSIINIVCKKETHIVTGDHIIVVGSIIGIYLNEDMCTQKNLLSIANEDDYQILAAYGIHKLGVPRT